MNDKLPVGKFLAWKSRDVSIACITVIVSGYLSIFCTDTLGMEPKTVGIILLVSKLIDVLTDFFAGYIVDNTKTKLGKGRPYELCIIGSWICTALLFFCPADWQMTVKEIWLFVMYTLLFSLFNTMLAASQNPYMIRAFPNKRIISKVASFGGIITALGAIIVSVTFPILMAKLAVTEKGWQNLILIYAIPLCLLGILRFIFVKEDPSIDEASGSPKIDLKQIMQMFIKNKYTWVYALLVGFYNFCVGMNVGTFYFKYIVKNISLMSIISGLSIIMLPVMFIFPKLMKKMSVANLIEAGTLTAIAGCIILFFAKASIPLLITGNILVSLASLPISYLGILIIMELATYNEWNGIARMEASTTAISNLSSKAFNGFGTGMQGILLSAFGYVSVAGVTEQAGNTLFAIRCMYSIIPMICYAGILICAFILGKLEKQMPAMEKEIAERRKENAHA